MDEQPQPAALVALRHRRERTIEILCEHFAADHLEPEELEILIDAAHQATSIGQLDELLRELPELPEEQPGTRVALAEPEAVRERGAVLAVMGGAERKGAWVPSRQNYVVAVMGGVELDFREARMPAGVTELYVLAMMGGVEIVVPPGLRVESSGIGIMGAFEHSADPVSLADPSAPVLRISGLGLMGAVEIHERLPGESARDARRRMKAARRERGPHWNT